MTQAFVRHARVVTSLGQECDIVRQSCPLQLTIETPWGPVRFTMPFIVFPRALGWPEMTTAGAVGEPNDSTVLRAAMAVTAFGPGGDAPGDVDDDATLMLPSQRPMIQGSEVECRTV